MSGHICRDCLTLIPDNLRLHLPLSKNDLFSQGSDSIGPGGPQCRALNAAWAYLAGTPQASQSAPLLSYANSLALDRQSLTATTRLLLSSVGSENSHQYCSHSFRIRVPTTAALAGIPEPHTWAAGAGRVTLVTNIFALPTPLRRALHPAWPRWPNNSCIYKTILGRKVARYLGSYVSLYNQNGDVWRSTWNFGCESGPAHVGHGCRILVVFWYFS